MASARRHAGAADLLPQRGAGEEEHQRRDDAAVDEQRIDRPEPPGADAFVDDPAERSTMHARM